MRLILADFCGCLADRRLYLATSLLRLLLESGEPAADESRVPPLVIKIAHI